MGPPSGNQPTSRRWILPAVVCIATLLLLLFGRDIIAALFAFLAVAFGIALVLLLVAMAMAMARPGPSGALHGLPRTPADARSLLTSASHTLQHTFGQAPRRNPATVAASIQRELPGLVAEMATGPVAYGHLWVGLHPDTLRRVDEWLPVEDFAWLCADQYAAAHLTTVHMSTDVSVAIACDPDTPRGRHTIVGGFRPVRPESDRWAVARCDYPPGDAPARRPEHTVLRLQADDLPEPHPGDSEPARDGFTRLDPGSTVRMPAAGPRPVGATDDLTMPVDPDATEPLSATPALSLTPLAGGSNAARAIKFTKGPVRVGRSTDADWRVDDPYVSRTHAELRTSNGQWTITDKGSSHGTFVNLIPIRGPAAHALREGDVISLGGGKDKAASFKVSLAPR